MSDNTGSAKAQVDKVAEKKETDNAKAERASFNMERLEALANLIDQHGLTEFEFENEDIRIRLSKQGGQQSVAAPQPAPTTAPAATPDAASAAAEPAADPDAGLHKITSPIVGTFYRSPSPDKDPYVSEGTSVGPETTVCIVEAMKLMNEIQAEVSGEIVKIYVENGQPVEYGQPLFGVKK